MLELREAVLQEWEKRVRASVRQAQALKQPILTNALPVLYDKLAEAVTPQGPGTGLIESTTIATEHGGERARLTDYDPQAVIVEYQILKSSIFDVLKKAGVRLQENESSVISASIDAAIRESVASFALVYTALREQFMAALTHDLRTPLSSANIAVELIARRTDSPGIRDLARRALDNHNRMDRMIQGLLDSVVFQRGERLRLDLSTFDILDVAREVQEQANTLHDAPRVSIAGDSVVGTWGRDALKRALENLVGNAEKYGTPDTPIRISIEQIGGKLLLSVNNDGDPIPPEDQECIFQVFKRAQAARDGKNPGWGIGLPFVRAVAESHGGSITMSSSAEQGTAFTIDIPVDSGPFQGAPTLGSLS